MRPRGTRTVEGVMPEPTRYRGATTVYLPGRSDTLYVPSARVVTRVTEPPPRRKTRTTPAAGLLHGCASMQTGRVGDSVTNPRSPEEAEDPDAAEIGASTLRATSATTRRHIPRE